MVFPELSKEEGEAWAKKMPLHSAVRSEEHTSELQSQSNLVCRLLLEKKKIKVVCSDAIDVLLGTTLCRARDRDNARDQELGPRSLERLALPHSLSHLYVIHLLLTHM